MAALVTANRWNGKLDTHKTNQGPMLCTGIGCLGCFPDLRQNEASEIGICDVDQPVYTLRPWLNDPNNKTKGSTSKRRRKKKSQRKAKVKTEEREEKAAFGEVYADEIKVADAETQTCGSDPSKFVYAPQTKDSTPQIENARPDKAIELPLIDEQFLEEMADYESDPKESCTHTYSDIVTNLGKGDISALAGKVYDNMYVGRDRNIALSLQDDCLPTRPFSNSDHCEQSLPNGEDAICFFFALEYYQSARDLPEFKVMEIVESLSKNVDLEDIKCVQRVNECWHIVLRSRKYTSLLQESGIRIRGRKYEVIHDTDTYFDVVYGRD